MRALAFIGCLLIASTPAHAILEGRATRDPNGVRQSVVQIENAEGELCSGTLVAQDIVLTAAHCMAGNAVYRVTGVDRNFRPRRARAVAAAIHPLFVHGTTPRTQPGIDLALLKLEQPLGPDFTPIDLSRAASIGTGTPVRIAGFGVASERERRSARTLRETTLVAIGPMQIRNRVLVAADGERLAATTGAGACRGDSGGPIFVAGPGGYQIAGIVSWSSGALRASEPRACGGLTAVTPIDENLAWIVKSKEELRAFAAGFAPSREEARSRSRWARRSGF